MGMKFRAALFAVGGLVWALLPVLAYAQGLVPCAGLDCNLCNIAELVQNIINFLVGISIPVAIVMFGWAGILMFTNADNPGRIERGRKIFSSVFIGFVMVIAGWLIVQTVIGALVLDSFNFTKYWNGLSCDHLNRLTDVTIAEYLDSALGSPQPVDTSHAVQSVTSYSCSSYPGFTLQGTSCVGPGGSFPATPSYTSTQSELRTIDPELASRIASACTKYGGSVCSTVQSISFAESSGGRNCKPSNTGAVGCMQVLATTGCDVDAYISSSCGACVKSKNSTSAACAPVHTALADPDVNTRIGVDYVAKQLNVYKGSCELAAAAYYRGSGEVKKFGNTVPPLATSYVAKVCGS